MNIKNSYVTSEYLEWNAILSLVKWRLLMVASINDVKIRKTMIELWTTTYNYMELSSPMSNPSEIQTKVYNNRKAELMVAILLSSYNIVA